MAGPFASTLVPGTVRGGDAVRLRRGGLRRATTPIVGRRRLPGTAMGGARPVLGRRRCGPRRAAAACLGWDACCRAARADRLAAGGLGELGPIRAGWCPFAWRGSRMCRPAVDDHLGVA